MISNQSLLLEVVLSLGLLKQVVLCSVNAMPVAAWQRDPNGWFRAIGPKYEKALMPMASVL